MMSIPIHPEQLKPGTCFEIHISGSAVAPAVTKPLREAVDTWKHLLPNNPPHELDDRNSYILIVHERGACLFANVHKPTDDSEGME